MDAFTPKAEDVTRFIGEVIERVLDSMEHVYFITNEYGMVLFDTVSTVERDTLKRFKETNNGMEPEAIGCSLRRIDRQLIVLPLEKSEYVSGAKQNWLGFDPAKAGAK